MRLLFATPHSSGHTPASQPPNKIHRNRWLVFATLFALEIIACFAATATLLSLGVFYWVASLPARLMEPSYLFGGGWVFEALVLGGVAAFASLFRLLYVLARGRTHLSASWKTRFGMLAGIVLAAAFAFASDGRESVVLGWMPLLGALHTVYLARSYVFGNSRRD